MRNQFTDQNKIRKTGKVSVIMMQGALARRDGKPPTSPYKGDSKEAKMWLAGWNMPSATSDYISVDCQEDPAIAKLFSGVPKSKPRSKAKPETALVRECIKWCRANGLFVWRNNTGTFQMGAAWLKFSMAGAPDIIGLLSDGKFLGIECKVKPNRQSELQKQFQEKIEFNKGVYVLVYSVYELANKLPFGWRTE